MCCVSACQWQSGVWGRCLVSVLVMLRGAMDELFVFFDGESVVNNAMYRYLMDDICGVDDNGNVVMQFQKTYKIERMMTAIPSCSSLCTAFVLFEVSVTLLSTWPNSYIIISQKCHPHAEKGSIVVEKK